jgi:hypothetical protein
MKMNKKENSNNAMKNLDGIIERIRNLNSYMMVPRIIPIFFMQGLWRMQPKSLSRFNAYIIS